jgi:hypothetical protein
MNETNSIIGAIFKQRFAQIEDTSGGLSAIGNDIVVVIRIEANPML